MAHPVFKKRRLSLEQNNMTDRFSWRDNVCMDEMLTRAPARGRVTAQKRDMTGNPSLKNTHLIQNAYSSELFQLQINELLSRVRPDYERRLGQAEVTLRKLREIIEHIPAREAKQISEAEWEQFQSYGVRVPFPIPRPAKDAKYSLAYSRPVNINVVGSFAHKTAVQVEERLTIDLAVTMPSQLFQEKDHLNYRYFYKRAFYVACVASGILEAGDGEFDLKFAYQNDSQLQPVVLVSLVGDPSYQVRIILAFDENHFPIPKTLPNKSCIRVNVETEGLRDRLSAPTPFYNASLRSECSLLAYSKLLHGVASQTDGFVSACILGNVWLRQRGLGTGTARGGFGPFEWACIMATLLRGGNSEGKSVFSTRYSSYQLFKATLQFLSSRDLVTKPLFINAEALELSAHEQPILFDGATGMNILFKMTPWSYALLKHETSITLQMLGDPLADHFNTCFIDNIKDPTHRFDCVISVATSQQMRPMKPAAEWTDFEINYCRRLYQVLKKGLGDRVRLIVLEPPLKHAWLLRELAQHCETSGSVQIGLLLQQEHINRIVDKGPSTEDKASGAEFRRFWGEKAELRRFRDGSILESLVWSTANHKESLLMQIMQYLVRRHIGEDAAKSLSLAGESFDHSLSGSHTSDLDHAALYQPIMDAFEVMQKDLRSLAGLPLQIRQISAGSPQLRDASVRAPMLDITQRGMNPLDIYVQFEGFFRWPDKFHAVQITKMAFLLKMGGLLQESIAGLAARMGLENTGKSFLNVAFLDVTYPSGAFFRLRIHHERELSLLEHALKKNSHLYTRREETAAALSAYKRNFVQTPLHSQAVRTLSTRFPLLIPSMRLVKRWRDCHLLSGYISDELIELLTIHTFVHPYPWAVPGSIMTGFLRTLRFISKWDWRSEPLIVDFMAQMSSRDIGSTKLRLEAWRKADPAMNRIAMFAASNLDPHGITWTELGPAKVVAARFTSLAKKASLAIKEQMVEHGLDFKLDILFEPSLADYDFIIHLNQEVIRSDNRAHGNNQAKLVYKNLQIESKGQTSMGFKPVQSFLDELKALYSSNILFFHDRNGGAVIGGCFNPLTTGPRPWKINLPYSSLPTRNPTNEDVKLRINLSATLHDIARLGGDMISSIQVQQ